MYNTLKNGKIAKVALIVLVASVAFLLSSTQKSGNMFQWLPGSGFQTVYADDSSSDSSSASPLFTPVMKDSSLSN